MAFSFTIKLQLRVCQCHWRLCRFSFRLPVCATHKLVDILWPKRGRGFIKLSHGSHFVCPQPSFSSSHIGLEHPPLFLGQHTEAWWDSTSCLTFVFRQ